MALEIIFMDAGQGDSTLIIYPDKSLVLVDCGSKKNKDLVSAEIGQVLTRCLANTPKPPAPYKWPAGNWLKAIVLTHPDGDHYNLIEKRIVDKGVKVMKVFHGGAAEHYDHGKLLKLFDPSIVVALDKPGCSVAKTIDALSYKGKSASDPDVEVRLLAANVGDPSVKEDANPNSLVFLITYSTFNIFLMGDSTEQTEDFIEKKFGAAIGSLVKGRRSILKVGHHGSNTSSGATWLNRVLPQVAFVSSDTKSFKGVSIPRSTIMDRILAMKQLDNFDKTFLHSYVQYNDDDDCHEEKPSTRALYTILHRLDFKKSKIDFEAYGTSWYYGANYTGEEKINPACSWDKINKIKHILAAIDKDAMEDDEDNDVDMG